MAGARLAGFLMIAAAAFAPPASQAATPPNMLVIGTDLSLPTLDPAALNARTVSEAVSNLYDNLVQIPPDDLQTVRPMLAESWEVSPDKRSITMTMREGATFASGNPVTALDAAWTIQRVIKLGQVGATDIAAWGFTPENVDSLVKAVDERTLTIDLPEPVSPDLVLYSLAGSSLGIIDRQTALEHEVHGDLARDWLKGNAAPSGAFTLQQYRPNDIFIAQARDDYWDGEPAMQRVIMRHIPESGSLRLQIEAGDVDVGHYVASNDLAAFAESDEVTIQNVPGFGFYYVALNMKDPDLQKPLVRQAFQHMMDWEALSRSSMRFYGFPWQSIVPKGMAGAPEEMTTKFNFDPERAKELLAEAGYPNGLRKTLYPAGAAHLENAEAFQASARLAGVELNLVPGEHVPDFRARTFEVYMGNSGARLPDPFATAMHYAFNPDNRDEANLGGYYLWRVAQEAPELLDLVERSKTETDPQARAEMFAQMEAHYQTMDPALIVFFQRTDPYVVRNEVKGYQGHPAWSTRWAKVTKE
ncbi:ABC transporter substrate-binding protein [Marinivivus vitaminiproducens]|uniref:ABC transporter substrate-binding protein n=1 Tax=Marinivivus vitaminiproducens TaxID=3035935 RepID=UPI00279A6F39|nr:ABC transporter substrate-binding protein [Geminicoccaceae bacterium SCSIO 64248]